MDLEFEHSASHIHHAVAKEDIEPAEWAFEYTKFLGHIKILRNPFLGPSGPRLDKSCIAPTNLGQLSHSDDATHFRMIALFGPTIPSY